MFQKANFQFESKSPISDRDLISDKLSLLLSETMGSCTPGNSEIWKKLFFSNIA